MKSKKILSFALTVFCGCIFALSGCSAANAAKYDPSGCEAAENALTGKTIYWLGSSVTLGMKSENCSMADYISARNGVTCVKEAVSGTTLIDEEYWGKASYTVRMKEGVFDKSCKIDAFICQISTNDAKKENISKWGTVTGKAVKDISAFDVKTTLGAIEYVISYVESVWDCPIYFYSGAYFSDKGERSSRNPKGSDYKKLIEETKKIADKWNAFEEYDVRIIDLFNDEEFNGISDEKYNFYMHDPVHPYKAGYLEWWTPAFEKRLLKDFGESVGSYKNKN